MRRSLGNGGGREVGGGSGGTMRSFQRAIRAGVGGGASANTTTTTPIKKGKANNIQKKQHPTSPLTLHSSPNSSSAPFPSLLNLPISAPAAARISSSSSTNCSDESEWEYVDGIEDETAARALYDDYLFGTVPSSEEVYHAVSALQKALGSSSQVSSPKAKLAESTHKLKHKDIDERKMVVSLSEIDRLEPEPSQNLFNSKMLQHPIQRSDLVYDAFHLLETEPSVQKMVVSLSSDKAVWDAVLNNDVVKELRGTMDRVSSLVNESSNKASDESNGDDENILSWIVMFAKGKMMQLLNIITRLMNNVFVVSKQNNEGDDDGVDGKVKSSFFLSLIVLLVVILARTKNNDA